MILEGEFGILPIEIKYGSSVQMKSLRAITQFVKEHGLPYGMLINQSDKAEWLNPHIIQIPVGCI